MNTHISTTSELVARNFADWLVQHIPPGNAFHWALSGGSTPKILFDLLAREYATRLPWSDIHFWWGDERCVPPDHAESNFRMTQERLLGPLHIPSENVHRIKGETIPFQESARYGESIEHHLNEVKGWPVFDLIMLGMGSDGHTASIFPHQMELLEASTICAVATHPESGQKRVSLTGHVLNAAKQVAFLVTGPSKTEKVAAIFGQTEEASLYPAAYIKAPQGQVHWFMDEAAAGDLQ